MTGSKFISSMLLAGTVALGGAGPAEAAPPVPAASSQGLARAVADGLAKNDIVMLGDTDHGNMSLNAAFTDKKLVEQMAAGGVKHLFLEIPSHFQPKIDALQNGTITKQEFVTAYKSTFENMHQSTQDRDTSLNRLADSLSQAAQSGIRVHAADAGLADEETRRYDAALGKAYAVWREQLSPKDQGYFDLWQAGQEGDIPQAERYGAMLRREQALHAPAVKSAIAETNRLLEAVDKVRLDDSKTYDIIAASLKAGEKGVVIYGNKHYQSQNGLDNFLAHDYRVARIDVHPSAGTISYASGAEKPQTIFITETSEALQGGGQAPVAAKPPKP